MKKGFIFTLDAAFAAVIVLTLVTAFLLIAQQSDSGNAFQEMQKKASDAAVVSAYTGADASGFAGIEDALSSDAKDGACSYYNEKRFCGELT